VGIGKWLGFETGQLPYDIVVEYETGTAGNFHLWARDGRDAVIQLAKLLPAHDVIVKIEFRLREQVNRLPRGN
jgi:hypothetical protein